ncbi:MAG: molecular chaperone HtpG [Candidatus Methanomethylophilus sp.]|nr:molecular chaperone HtpG [Methanomethylophilus sp.]MDD4669175.1 molecular chaperone HtpG [Methanomethylophilus sp.]
MSFICKAICMEKKQFKTESKRILDLMVNSIYTHREIFLRELISNASDAIDKMNYRALTEPSVASPAGGFRIDVAVDKAARAITVSDNGIGMTKDEMEKDLGVIAYSGSRNFKQGMDPAKVTEPDTEVIGQFGVGFYSAFMVADRVKVVSRAYGQSQAYGWESTGADGYTIGESTRDRTGTDIIMYVKASAPDGEDYDQYLDPEFLKELVEKYSDYIRWPIHMQLPHSEYKETGEKDKDGNPVKDKDGKPKMGYVTTIQDSVVNSMVPIWRKSKEEADDKACGEFYKDKFRDFEDPLAVIRMSAEGVIDYKALLFIPAKAPYDFFSRDFQSGLQLYANGVLIMDHCADLLPYPFRFVRGVIDSPDFSLNISREVLQQDRQLKAVGASLTKKVKAELLRILKEEPDKYRQFYASFGTLLKYGVMEDYGKNKELLEDLLLFHSADQEKLISLADYVKAMPADQKKIYYVIAGSAAQGKALPQTEPLKTKKYDFFCLTEDVDSFIMRFLQEYEKKPFCDATSQDLGLETEEEKKAAEQKDETYKDLLAFAKEKLNGKVENVKISHKLKSHPVLLTTDGPVTLDMEKYYNDRPELVQGTPVKAKRVLELNADSNAFKALDSAFKSDKDKAARFVQIMYNQACIIAGVPVDDAVSYSDLVFGLF